MKRLLQSNQRVRAELSRAQAAQRSGALVQRALGGRPPKPQLDHLASSRAAAAKATLAWQDKAARKLACRILDLGFRDLEAYLLQR